MTDPSPRVIGAAGSFALVAGSMLGVGIFLAPPVVASHVTAPWQFYALWLLGGLVAFAGAVACAELGTLLPRSGGDYVFQHAAFGPSVAFASGWVLVVAIFAGSIATMTTAMCQYQLPGLLGVDLAQPCLRGPGFALTGTQLTAVAIVLGLTGLNLSGARPSTTIQSIATLVPLGAFFLLAIAALVLLAPPALPTPAPAPPELTVAGIATSYNAIYFAYAGWINVIYVAGEVRRPERNIPLGLIAGTIAVTALYLLICSAFVTSLGMPGLAAAGEAGSALATRLGGAPARTVMTACIAVALLASVNATVLGGARILRAMAEEGATLPWFSQVTRTRAPARALWAQALWTIALILSGTFETLLQMVSLAMVLTGSITVASLFVLRWRRPDAPRPFRATGYPVIPAFYVAASAVIVVVMLQASFTAQPPQLLPLLGLAVLVVAFAGHALRRRLG